MEKKYVIIVAVILVAVIALWIYLYSNGESPNSRTNNKGKNEISNGEGPNSRTNNKGKNEIEFNPDFTSALPHTVIYKTKLEYYGLVTVTLSEDKTQVISGPDKSDAFRVIELGQAFPLNLSQGYLSSFVWNNTAFLNVTYEEFSKLDNPPSSFSQLYTYILDKSPFSEMYDCGVIVSPNKTELDNIIDSGQLTKCKYII